MLLLGFQQLRFQIVFLMGEDVEDLASAGAMGLVDELEVGIGDGLHDGGGGGRGGRTIGQVQQAGRLGVGDLQRPGHGAAAFLCPQPGQSRIELEGLQRTQSRRPDLRSS